MEQRGEDEDPVMVHLVAGTAAGVAEHVLMYPLDSVKTRLQSLAYDQHRTISRTWTGLVQEGAAMRGVWAPLVGAGPAHALYFAAYEAVKSRMSSGGENSTLANSVAATAATLLHDVVMTPTEVVKQRMQMRGSLHVTCRACLGHVMRHEGVGGLYRSLSTQLAINLPFHVAHFVVYEECEERLNPTRMYSPASHVVSGAVSGGAAAFLTNPLDVCKTLLNTQQHRAASLVRGLPNAVRTVRASGGAGTFWRGATARVLLHAPSAAISWSVYELFKRSIFAAPGGNEPV